MPLYEYQCKKCGRRFEKIQKFSDPKVKKCPECGGAVELVISAPAVQFKGSGWYVTDYANKPHVASASAGSDKDSKKEEKSMSEAGGKDESSREKSAKEGAKASSSKKTEKHK